MYVNNCAYELFVQAPKPPSETSERRLSRDKGPAPPPPPMRQDSEEKKKRDDEKETAMKDVEKVNATKLVEKNQKPIEDKLQNNKLSQEKTADQQANIKEQRNSEMEDQTQNELNNSEKIKKPESENSGKLFDNIKRFENQQKLINNKSSPASKKQLNMNEKRKSAPVKPEMIEDLSKIIYNKQLSLEDKDRYVSSICFYINDTFGY